MMMNASIGGFRDGVGRGFLVGNVPNGHESLMFLREELHVQR